MTDSAPNEQCKKCGGAVAASVSICPACGHDRAPTPGGGFALEGDDSAPADTPTQDVPAKTQPISPEDLPPVDEPESAGETIRMSMSDMGAAWLEETSEGGGTDTPPAPESKRKGCLPLLAILIAGSVGVLALL